MTSNSVDLANLFQAVTQELQTNQSTLDRADAYNQDHGSNMVKTFQTITNALERKKGTSDSAALAYAAKKLSQSATSGSAKVYAQNLTQAASQFKGKNVDEKGALQLLQTLIGSGQAPQGAGTQAGGDMLGALLGGMAESGNPSQQASSAGGGDLLGALLGGMAESGTPSQQAPAGGSGDLLGALLGGMAESGNPSQQASSTGSGDLLGALLGGLAGGGTASAGSQQGSGIDMQDLLAAGMAFMQARQQGQGNLQALVQAFVAGSGMGGSVHRDQSTQVVVQSFLQALSGMSSRQ